MKQQAKELHGPGNSAAHQQEGMVRTVKLCFTCTVYTARAACACWVQKPNNTATLGTYYGH